MSALRKTHKEFVREAKRVHGTTYSYEKTNYELSRIKVIITCKKHGDFLQSPRKHLNGAGCMQCSREKHSLFMTGPKTSLKEFKELAFQRFGLKFTFKHYQGLTNPVEVLCSLHGSFTSIPTAFLRTRFGCPKCGMKQRTTKQFISEAQAIHGDRYSYSKVSCLKNSDKVGIVCPDHGLVWMSQRKHLNSCGCPRCGKQIPIDQLVSKKGRTVIKRFRAVHGTVYDYSSVVYTGRTKPVEICCKTHGIFLQKPSQHLAGFGCPVCYPVTQQYSLIAIRWIKEEAKARKMRKVLHAQNGGEYKIPGTNYRVDGFHPPSNTVFEFHGDCFHGNPAIFKPTERPHPFNNQTAKELYARTLKKETVLRSLGYTVVSIWESDYLRSKK